jgi:hypothetical protein
VSVARHALSKREGEPSKVVRLENVYEITTVSEWRLEEIDIPALDFYLNAVTRPPVGVLHHVLPG